MENDLNSNKKAENCMLTICAIKLQQFSIIIMVTSLEAQDGEDLIWCMCEMWFCEVTTGSDGVTSKCNNRTFLNNSLESH